MSNSMYLYQNVGVHVQNENEIQILLNPLNTKLNPMCHLLVMIGAHHIFYVSRIRVKISVVKNTDG